MRYQGKITGWKDGKGFGFVATNGKSEKAFIHIKAFADRSRRPAEGDLVSYELILEQNGRFRADKVRFAGAAAADSTPARSGPLGVIFAAAFCCLLLLAGFGGKLPFAFAGLYLVASVVAFVAYAIDKSAAQSRQWRIKESNLHILALLGGWPGALLAQKLLRHKTRKEQFQTVFWLTVLLNCCALGWLFTESGSAFIRPLLHS